MAEPKLQIEKRLDRIEDAIEKIAEAIVQSPDISTEDAEEIIGILRGEDDASEESGTEEMGVRNEGSGLG